jgi:secreted PhoX family phosphatase
VKTTKTLTIVGVSAALVALGAPLANASHDTETAGTTSSQSPYIVPVADGVTTRAILTTGDSVGGYRFAGIPDGLAAFENDDEDGFGDDTFTVLVNHEIGTDRVTGAPLGVVRAHGAAGAFVTKLTIDEETLKVVKAEDLIQRVYDWKDGAWATTTTAFNRFCSGDLAPVTAFYDKASRTGTKERIYLNGEESGNEGRAVAHVATGKDAGSSYILPWLGRFSWENAVAKPGYGQKTVVVGTDDTTPGQIYVYVGTKQKTGNAVERAGLTNGTVYGIKVDGVGNGASSEISTAVLPVNGATSPFTLVALGDVSALTGAQLQAASNAAGLTEFARPEDSSWDPSNAQNLYAAMTNAFNRSTRLWRFTFTDASNVLAGGTATIALQGPAFDPAKSNADQAGPRMLDNITVNGAGEVLGQEDVGGNDYLGGVYRIDPVAGIATRIAQHDPARFVTGAPGFLTIDEESSGIIPVPFLGKGAYLLDSQAHYATDAETVEGGQLLLLRIKDGRSS